MDNEPTKKTCKKCGSLFVSSHCDACARERSRIWSLNNKERKKESDRKRSIEKKVENQQYRIQYREKNPDYYSNYYQNNRDSLVAAAAAFRAANPDKHRAAVRAWAKLNPAAVLISNQNRRAKIAGRGGRLSAGIRPKLFKLQRGKCACCGLPLGNKYHVDHKMPLALGGMNIDENIQLLRSVCNLKKGAKHPIDFMQSRGFLL